MFIVAAKTAIVEALRSVWYISESDNELNPDLKASDRPYPRRVTIEYPEEPEDWPFILVQLRPTLISWTGITPDEIVNAGTEDSPSWKRIRQGRFEATCMLQIIALSSEERDRMWDNAVNLLLLGRTRNPTDNFYSIVDTHDLVGMTIMEGSVRPVGDSISMGTPWDPEILTYEAAIEFDITGIFYADEYNSDLVTLTHASIYEFIPTAEQEPNYSRIGTLGETIQDEDGILTINLLTNTSLPEAPFIIGIQNEFMRVDNAEINLNSAICTVTRGTNADGTPADETNLALAPKPHPAGVSINLWEDVGQWI